MKKAASVLLITALALALGSFLLYTQNNVNLLINFAAGNGYNEPPTSISLAYCIGICLQLVITLAVAIGVCRGKGRGWALMGLLLLCGWGFLLGDRCNIWQQRVLAHMNGDYTSVYFSGTARTLSQFSSFAAVAGCAISLANSSPKGQKLPKKLSIAALVLLAVAFVYGLILTVFQLPLSLISDRMNDENLLQALQRAMDYTLFEGGFMLQVSPLLMFLLQAAVVCIALVRSKKPWLYGLLAVLLVGNVYLWELMSGVEITLMNAIVWNNMFGLGELFSGIYFNWGQYYWLVNALDVGPVLLCQIATALSLGGVAVKAFGASKAPEAQGDDRPAEA